MHIHLGNKKYLKLFLLAAVFSLAFCLIPAKKANAQFFMLLNPDPDGSIPAYQKDQLHHCNYSPPAFSPAFWQWVGDANSPGSQAINVTYGQRYINLTLQWSSAVCSTPNQVPESRLRTDGATVTAGGGSISGAVGKVLQLVNGGNVGDYRNTGYNFTYDAGPGGLTSSKTIDIRFDNRSINRFSNGYYGCIALPRPSAGGGWNYGNCPAEQPSFSIRFNVPPPPDGTIYVSKYAPHTHPADGNFSNVPAPVNSATTTIAEVTGISPLTTGPVFGAWNSNGINIGGLFSNRWYKVKVDNPSGYSYYQARVNGTPQTMRCEPGGCYALIFVQPGAWYWLDFWYDPPPPTCDKTGNLALVTSPATPEPGESFSVTLPFSSSYTPLTFTVTVNSSGLPTLDGRSKSGTAPPTSATFGNVTAASAGRYTVTYSVTTSAGNLSGCKGTITVGNKPYLKIYGNDAAAGGAFKSNCSISDVANPKATILTRVRIINPWFNFAGGNEDWTGASTEYAAFALGEINEFSSAGQHSPRTNNTGTNRATPVHDLTFGNFDPSRSIQSIFGDPAPTTLDNQKVINYGGKGGVVNCIADYYTEAVKKGAGVTSGAVTVSSTTGRTISGQVAQVVNGSAYIYGDIAMQNSGTTWGSSPNNIPTFVLIVRGNIYIQPGVSRLDGIYIAEPDPANPNNTGRIYTCINGNAPIAASQLFSAPPSGCNNKLTINGAFLAKQVKFRRTNGTVKQAGINESSSASGIAEVFNFPPELYIAPLPDVLKRSEEFEKYDFVTSLPPIL